MKENLVRDKGWKLLVRLFKSAKKDGKIDPDEQRILHTTDLNVTYLLNFVKEAWKDNKLTEDEKKRIIFLIKKIEDDAITLAEYDDILTNQEQDMLDIIRPMIYEFLNMN